MIPKTLHQIWLGPPMPDHLLDYRVRWMRLHPDWTHKLWGDNDLGWLENRDLYEAADEISPRSVWQFRSDIARIEIVHRYAGVYADSDMEPCKRIDPLLDVPAFVFRHPTPNGRPNPKYKWLINALIGAEQGHPAMRAAIDGMRQSVRENKGLRTVFTVGPRYVTRIWQERDDIVKYPAAWAFPYGWQELHRGDECFPDAYAVHHWNNRRSGGYVGDAA